MMLKSQIKLKITSLVISILLLVAVLVVLPLGISFGWFTDTKQTPTNNPDDIIKPMKVAVKVSFDGNTPEENLALTPANLDIALNPTPVQKNTLDNLRVSVKYEGSTAAAVRVHVIHVWYYSTGGNYPSRTNVKFKIAGMNYDQPTPTPPTPTPPTTTRDLKFIDDSQKHSLYYYCNASAFNHAIAPTEQTKLDNLNTYKMPSATTPETFTPLIVGLNQSAVFEETLCLKLIIMAEAVQLNRAEAIWGTLPVPPTVPPAPIVPPV